MSRVAEHLIATIGWTSGDGWADTRDVVNEALALGVAGFVVRGGPRQEVSQLTRVLHAHGRVPLLVGADVARGVGDRFLGGVYVPPGAALAALDDVEAVRRAARVTAVDAREMGVNWALGPACAVGADVLAVHTVRGFHGDASLAATCSAEWIDACQAESVLTCATPCDEWPVAAVIDAGVASLVVAHPTAATVKALRDEHGFEGLIVADLDAQCATQSSFDETEAAIEALAVGTDLVLGVRNLTAVVHAIETAVVDGRLTDAQLTASRARREWWATWGSWNAPVRGPILDDRMWAKQVSDRVLQVVRGRVPWLSPTCELLVVHDRVDRTAPSHEHFELALRALGRSVHVGDGATAHGEGVFVIAIYADARSATDTHGLTPQTCLAVRLATQGAKTLKRDTLVVLFGHPQLAADIPDPTHVLCAWGDDRGMQEAAARALVS